MKELLLLRHAKSSWDNPAIDDHDRPLNKRGLRDAPRMGERLRQRDLVPDLIVSSDSQRTRQTVALLAEAGGYLGETRFLEELYGTSTAVYLKVIQSLSDKAKRILVVGHNPTLENIVSQLCGEHQRFPTAALARFQLGFKHWKDFSLESEVKLVDLWRPKEIFG